MILSISWKRTTVVVGVAVVIGSALFACRIRVEESASVAQGFDSSAPIVLASSLGAAASFARLDTNTNAVTDRGLVNGMPQADVTFTGQAYAPSATSEKFTLSLEDMPEGANTPINALTSSGVLVRINSVKLRELKTVSDGAVNLGPVFGADTPASPRAFSMKIRIDNNELSAYPDRETFYWVFHFAGPLLDSADQNNDKGIATIVSYRRSERKWSLVNLPL